MLVVLDATVFCADFQMKGMAFRVFLSGFRRTGLKPCVPDSVIDEVLNKYRENCDELARQAAKLAHDASRLVGRDVIQTFPDKKYTDLLYSTYSSELRNAMMDHDFEHLPYPSISHKEVTKRALTKRRPFREHDAGYRDSLLWLSILEYLQKDRLAIGFVTNNTRDFGSKGELHEHLLEDLQKIDFPPKDITLFHTLSELNDALILPTLKRLDDVRQKLADESHPLSVRTWVDHSLLELLRYEEGFGPLEPDHGSTWVSKIDTVRSIHIDATRQLSQEEILVSARAEVDVTLSISADWDDYQKYEDVKDFFKSEDADPFSFASADFPLILTVAFTLILNADSLAAVSSELDWFEDEYGGRVDINPHVEDR